MSIAVLPTTPLVVEPQRGAAGIRGIRNTILVNPLNPFSAIVRWRRRTLAAAELAPAGRLALQSR